MTKYVKGIPYLTQSRLVTYKRVIKNYFNCGSWTTDPDTINAFKEIGFKLVESNTNATYCHYYYFHSKYKILIKRSYIANGKFRNSIKTPKRAIPSIVLFCCKHKCKTILIQPLADTSKKAIRKIQKEAGFFGSKERVTLWGADAHDGNMGLFKGKPVVFDW